MISYKRSIVIPVVSCILFLLIGIGIMAKSEPAIFPGLIFLSLTIPTAGYAYFLRKQGDVFILNEQFLEYQSKAGGERQRISFDQIAEIRYIVSFVYRDYRSNRLRIVGNSGTMLVEVHLNRLAEVDFNEIYHFIEQVAPQVKWDFSNS